MEFAIDWAQSPGESWRYDLREAQIGEAAPRFAPLQRHVMEIYGVTLLLDGEALIDACDDFVAALSGRLNGFWLPKAQAAVEIVANVAATQFTIRDQNLRDTWQEGVALHLYFRKEGQTAQAAKVTAVTLSGGNEMVTVDANVSVDATWEAMRLAYVRLASDDEEAEFEAENLQVRRLRVEELTAEYADLETGQTPIWLYRFYTKVRGGTISESWHFTSLDEDVASTLSGTISSTNFLSRPITHGSLRRTLKADREDTTIKTFWEAGNPLQKFLPLDLLEPLWLEIYEATLALPHNTTLRFIGEVRRPTMNGNEISAPCAGLLDVLGRQFPRMIIGPRCNHFLFDAGCGLNKASFGKDATIATIGPADVLVSGPDLAGLVGGYFAFGWIETEEGEKRTILGSSAADGEEIEIRINAPFIRTEETMTATLYPGCDGNVSTCRSAKFNNLTNFGGMPYVTKNLTVRAMEAETSHGNKK